MASVSVLVSAIHVSVSEVPASTTIHIHVLSLFVSDLIPLRHPVECDLFSGKLQLEYKASVNMEPSILFCKSLAAVILQQQKVFSQQHSNILLCTSVAGVAFLQ